MSLPGYWQPPAPLLYEIPGLGATFSNKPDVHVLQVAGNVTTGTHRYKLAWVDGGGTTLPGERSVEVTTNTASTGQVAVAIPEYPYGATHVNVYRTEAAGSTYKLVNASPLAKATYEGGIYLDNIADGSLGATAPVTKTSTTVANPVTAAAYIAALVPGVELNYLVAYWVAGWRWIQLQQASVSNTALVLVPGYWYYNYLGTENTDWVPYDDPVAQLVLPAFSDDDTLEWQDLTALLEMCVDLSFPITIEYGDTAYPVNYTVTATPAGQPTRTLSTNDPTEVPELICKVALTCALDAD